MSASLAATAGARARLRRGSSGRSLLIDFYAARCCTSGLVGDLETRWLEHHANAQVVKLAVIEDVEILADPRLVALLGDGAELVEAGLPFARTIGVRLAHPERWLAFLETPAARRRRPPEAAGA